MCHSLATLDKFPTASIAIYRPSHSCYEACGTFNPNRDGTIIYIISLIVLRYVLMIVFHSFILHFLFTKNLTADEVSFFFKIQRVS
jgi:hypothetical protein